MFSLLRYILLIFSVIAVSNCFEAENPKACSLLRIHDAINNLDIKDPLHLNETESSFSKEDLKGNFSLRNGMMSGLSSFKVKYATKNISSEVTQLSIIFSMDHFEFSGDYEIVDGFVKLNETSEYTLSGKGLFNFTLSNIQEIMRVDMEPLPGTDFLVATNLTVVPTSYPVSIWMENLLVNGEPMNWKDVSEELGQQKETLYPEETSLGLMFLSVAILDGCTMEHIEQLVCQTSTSDDSR